MADEVSKRTDPWEQPEFQTLLHFCEQQKLLNPKQRKRKRQPQRDDAAGRGDRARRTAAVGTYQKATSGVVLSMMEMSNAEDRQWASKLIPNLDFNTGIYVHHHHKPEVCDTFNGSDHPYAGLRSGSTRQPFMSTARRTLDVC